MAVRRLGIFAAMIPVDRNSCETYDPEIFEAIHSSIDGCHHGSSN